MRAISFLSLTLIMSAPAFAADLGTYRPGAPYHSIVAPGADVCDSQCAGDAQCRGWNYVKANPKAPGVCEFISSVSTPVPSQISISGLGVNSSPITQGLMQGGTNTVRVGTAVSASPRNSVTRVGNRTVVREAVPQQRQTQRASTQRRIKPTANMSLTEQQNLYRQGQAKAQAQPQARQQATAPAARPQFRDPRITRPQAQGQQRAQQPQTQRAPQGFRPMLDGQGRPAMPQQQQQMMRRPQAAPQARQPQVRQPQATPQRRGPARARSQAAVQPRSNGRPPVGQPILPPQANGQQSQAPASQMMPRASAGAPVTHQNAQQAFAQRQAQLAAQANMPADMVQQSLYGSLHDDVKVPASMAQVPSDPNAPIPTMASRPTTPVQADALEGLAGAPR